MFFCISANIFDGSPNECFAKANELLGEDYFKAMSHEDPNHYCFLAAGRNAVGDVIHELVTFTNKAELLDEQANGPIDLFDMVYQSLLCALNERANKSKATA